MLMRTLAAVSILAGAGCTTLPQETGFPTPDPMHLIRCERPQPLPPAAGLESPKAAQALATVTSNYARHHRCADRLDSLQDWVRGQMKVR